MSKGDRPIWSTERPLLITRHRFRQPVRPARLTETFHHPETAGPPVCWIHNTLAIVSGALIGVRGQSNDWMRASISPAAAVPSPRSWRAISGIPSRRAAPRSPKARDGSSGGFSAIFSLAQKRPASTRKTNRVRPLKSQDPVIRLHNDFRSKRFYQQEPGHRRRGIPSPRSGPGLQPGLRGLAVLVKREALHMRYENLRIPALFHMAELIGEVVGHGANQDGRARRNRYAG